MNINIQNLLKYLIILNILSFLNISYVEGEILPLKKPSLSKEVKKSKEIQNILKPLKKPLLKTEDSINKGELENKKTKKTNIEFLIPKSKPLIVKKEKKKIDKKSKYFKQRDFDLAYRAIQAFEKGKWIESIRIAKKAKDKSIYKFVQWKYLLTVNNQASFYDYKNFIDENNDFPRISRLKFLAEHKLSTKKISHKKIIQWFENEEPLSGYGKIILGESFILSGETQKGINILKDGWITAKLSRSEMKVFRKKFKKYLNTDDYIKRADYLAWENKYWDLKRMLRYLPKDYQLLYTARQLLMSKSYGVDNAISKVPPKFKNDPGLNYDRLKWRRKRGRVDSSLEILLKIPNTKNYMIRPDKWWKERLILSRSLLYKKKYDLAYKVSSKHALTEGPEYAEAEWMSGWISLSFLNDPIRAEEHFRNFYENVGYPISLSRGAFWLARTYETLGRENEANKWYRESSKYLNTYYGQLAFMKINPNENFILDEQMKIDEKYKKIFYENKLIKIIYLLDELDKDKYTKYFLRHLATQDIENGSEVLAAELATNISRYDFAIQIAKLASYEKRFHNTFNYPIISTPNLVNGRKIPEQSFILSIIRQESEFDIKANSSAGARGLMQLMTYTAKLVSKQANLPYSKKRLTADPEYNINLGSHYIAGLILEYDGSYPFAIAAYNAGPKRVRYWKRLNKNPQKNQIDYINWIELIKFKETRNYVQRVLENYNVYRYILEKKPIKMKNFFLDDPLY